MQSVWLDTEREVEMHFVSLLFNELGYSEDQEAAGLPFDTWEGVNHRLAEADLLYFAHDRHRVPDGEPPVLMERKATSKGPDAGVGQVRSYSYWIKPAYYIIPNGDVPTVYNYQGGAVPDVMVLDVNELPCESASMTSTASSTHRQSVQRAEPRSRDSLCPPPKRHHEKRKVGGSTPPLTTAKRAASKAVTGPNFSRSRICPALPVTVAARGHRLLSVGARGGYRLG